MSSDTHVIDVEKTPTLATIPIGYENIKGSPGQSNNEDTKEEKILQKVDQATKTMENNITAATQRGENLDNLQEMSNNIADQSHEFGRTAKQVKRKLWYKNMKMTMCITIVVLIGLLLVGGILYKMFGNKSQ